MLCFVNNVSRALREKLFREAWRNEYMNKSRYYFLVLLFAAGVSLSAQSHVSVPLDDPVYYVLDLAQTRGLCPPLPEVKPYSRAVILSALKEILASEAASFRALSEKERRIIETAKTNLEKAVKGFNWQRGLYHFDAPSKKTGNPLFSGDLGVGMEVMFGGGAYFGDKDFAWGTDSWIYAYTNGDIGEHFSYGFKIAGGIIKAPRSHPGNGWTYYTGYPESGDPGQEGSYFNRNLPVYSDPLSSFPYSYRTKWDGSIFSPGSVSAGGILNWPEGVSVGSSIISELSGELFGDMLTYRFGRISHEWGGMTTGSSLVLNAASRPFVALEAVFDPVPWFRFSALTGVLEYFNAEGVKASSQTNQNAFSIEQLELNYKNYFHFDIGSTAIWPKRFELGYIFPINNNFMYQNNIGDFDNMALFSNIKFQYPGIISVWGSFFADEIEISSIKRMFELDRHMFAYQAGARGMIPWLPFASITVTYTKIEPYCYTHTRNFVPWYGNDNPMETSYTNNGVGLGYYLPPNSDEVQVRFDTMPAARTSVHLRYQMIRHGAEYGSRAVDGSSYVSELDPEGRSENEILRKYFLRDGAYQWQHIVRAGAAHTLTKTFIPIQLFGEFGVVFSYFTDISGNVNSGSPRDYSVIDNSQEYPKSTGIIGTFGFKLFF
jgi:hypothetical protein